MSDDLNRVPTWGVLVDAPIDRVTPLMKQLGSRFDRRKLLYRTSGSWTAVFYMEPDNNADMTAAYMLQDAGFVPVYHFDFNRFEFFTWKWDGEAWVDGEYAPNVLLGVGIRTPGLKDPSPPRPARTIASREATVLEGLAASEARRFVPDGLRVEDGPRGAIVYDADVTLRGQLWHIGRDRVFELEFYPRSGKFRLFIMNGDDCLGTFRPGETRTWDGTPFLPNVEGEVVPERIVELFGIERAFLAPVEEPTLSREVTSSKE